MKKVVNIVGINIQIISRKEISNKIRSFIEQKKTVTIFPVNVDMIVKANKDMSFKLILNNSFLIPDGKPLIWSSKILKTPLVEKTAGSDVFYDLCKMASEYNYKLFFLGAAEGIAAKAASILTKKYNNLNIVGTYSPPFDFENDINENNKIIDIINKANPDILFLAFGAPKQEKWIAKHKNRLKVNISFTIGATLDFVVGKKKMPPQVIKNAGFAWLYRLIDEPRRLWKRYLVEDIVFFKFVAQQKLGKKF